MKNKNTIFSTASLILAVLGYLNIARQINSTSSEESPLLLRIDSFIWEITNHNWTNATLDIGYYLSLWLPVIFLLLAAWFGYRALKNRDVLTPSFRWLSIISVTVSGFIICALAASILIT